LLEQPPHKRESLKTREKKFSTATLDSAFDNAGTAFTGSDNLKQNFDDFAKNFDGILSKAGFTIAKLGWP